MEVTSKEYNFEDGEVLLLNKPLTWTSFDLVKRIRHRLCKHLGVKKLKVGHAGTLDPLATGLMIICTGKATKQIDTYLTDSKEYIATFFLGATTPSFDLESEVDQLYPTTHITRELVDQAIESFLGEISQTPPIFSAIKIDGKRAYDLARAGEDVEMVSRKITMLELEVLRFEMPFLEVRVKCSKGTYIRSFARDMGIALGSGAYLAALIRTKIGSYSLSDAHQTDQFLKYLEELKPKSKMHVQ